MVVAKVGIAPEPAVDDMREALLGPDLQPAVEGPGDRHALRALVLRQMHSSKKRYHEVNVNVLRK
jgi:hypothetical protein